MCPCLSFFVLEGICISEDGFSMHAVLQCKRFINVSSFKYYAGKHWLCFHEHDCLA